MISKMMKLKKETLLLWELKKKLISTFIEFGYKTPLPLLLNKMVPNSLTKSNANYKLVL